MRPSLAVDQAIDLIAHHPLIAVACAGVAALLSWLATRGGDHIR